jgi:hypothetical protein
VHRPAKAIADCFKWRKRLGVALGRDALTAALDARLVDPKELAQFGELCRARGALAPYL